VDAGGAAVHDVVPAHDPDTWAGAVVEEGEVQAG
jgi:hypothetical protein